MHLRRPWHRMLLLPSLGLALLAQGARAQASASLRLDNDYFNFWQAPYQRPDVEYTQGADLSVRWPATTAWLRHLTPVPTPCADSVPPEVPCGLRIVSLGQDMYTPSIDSPRLLPGQRPYAGWLYLSFAERVESRSRVRGVALTPWDYRPPFAGRIVSGLVARVVWLP